jgi:hypothetical protein
VLYLGDILANGIFKLKDGAWDQLDNIDGEAAFGIGSSVALSDDGSIVAIGDFRDSGNGNGSGHVRIFEWNDETWVQLGDDIEGEAAWDASGWAVDLSSDGKLFAIGAPCTDLRMGQYCVEQTRP